MNEKKPKNTHKVSKESKEKLRTANVIEYKKIEEALRVSEHKLKTYIEGIPDGVIVSDLHGKTLIVNQTYLDMMGYKRREVLGGVAVGLPKKALPILRKWIKETIKNGHTKNKNIILFTKDKKPIPVNFNASLQKNTEGKPASIIVVLRDVTEIKKTEKHFKALFESSRDAIMTLEPPSWAFTSGNSSTITMFACKDEKDFTSRGPWAYSPKKQPDGQLSGDKAKAMIMKAMKKGVNFFEWTHKRLHGDDFSATVLLTRMTIGDKTFLQATVRDITERKKAEETLQKTKDELEKRVKERTAELQKAKDELQKKIVDLERFADLSVGRELKMVELKKKIKELEKNKK